MRFEIRAVSAQRLRTCVWLAVPMIAACLAGCGMSMPSASSMPAFSPSPKPKPRSTLGGPGATLPAHAGKAGKIIVAGEGETLMSIGRRYDVPMSVLMEQNNLRRIAIKPGTELFIPQL